ncbi:MAG TPA: amino acid adenylation domain-containing protein [Pyrinomonadaceae bacterium]|nr:amino acid adenylation domain-containing protein [Pyrinomonadaceae bacterium]
MLEQIVEGYELSPQQKELWRVMQRTVDHEFAVTCEVRIEGFVDHEQLAQAVDQVLARHEILRTNYEQVAGLSYPLQVIGERVSNSVAVSWSESGEATVLTIKLGAMSADRQSLHNLVQEIAVTYAAREETRAPYLQYADASEIFNELVASESGREHWESVKAAEVQEPELPFARGTMASGELAQWSFRFAPATQTKVIEFCDARGVTPKVVLLTAWAALLSRLSAQPQLRMFLTSEGRRHEELMSAVGLFSRRLPLVLNVEGNFTTAMTATSEQVEWAEKWQEYYEAERESGDGGYGFEFYQRPAAVETEGLRFEITREQVQVHPAWLSLGVGWGSTGARLELEYDQSMYSAADVERLSEEYETLVIAALTASLTPITDLEIVGARERKQLMAVMRGRRRAQSGEPVHETFLRQVQARPDAVAVIGEDEQLTYAELNRRANQLASYLVKRGVHAEQIVGISLERGISLVVGLLGILKSGGAYLPLDPAYPTARLQQMITDSGAALILSESQHTDSITDDGATVIYLDKARAEIDREPETDVETRVGPENLAYVLYTSGSTGRPKAVMIEHGALSNHMEWIIETAELSVSDTVLQKTGISFDASVWEFWGALQTGGTLAVGGTGVMGGDEIVSLVQKHHATVLQVVPTQLRLLLETDGFRECHSLRRVFSGGEALGEELVEKYYQQQNAVLTNLYGPTESTIDATWKEVQPGERVKLGRAVDNVDVWILGASQRLKASGEVGEIYISGAGLARGYLRRAAQTAEKFVPDGFSGANGGRLYRTGDLGRIVDGELQYVGRVDAQVKVRGFRVELGEIEAELNRQPEVKASAVVLQEDRLIAYVELRETVPAAELMKRLRERLPEWMVPGVYERVAKLPLSANGKVDRKRLSEVASERLTTGGEYAQARSGVEEVLAGIWSEVLKVERVGIHDNFFELGGDSILSIKVIARANRAGLKLTPRQLFQNQTVAELAAVATVGTEVKGEQGTVIGNVPLTPIQRRFFDENVDLHHYNQSVIFETREQLDETLLRRAITALIAHHDALRLRFHQDANGWQQTNAPVEQDCFTRIDLSAVAEQDRGSMLERAARDLQTSLNLTDGPLIRAALFTWPDGMPDRFMMVIHHLAIDGVSWRILLEDLQRAYGQLKDGAAIDLSFKTTSFQQWANKMVEYAQSSDVMNELPFWLDMLGPVQNSIPVDHPNGRNDRSTAERVSLSLDQDETRALLQDAPKKYRTQINDLLLTGLVEAFHHSAGLNSVAVNLEGHGREDLFDDLDLTRTAGWFTTIFPVRFQKAKGESVTTTLKRVKEVLRSLPNKGIGYGLLRYLSQDNDVLKKLREPQISLNYLGQLDQAVPQEMGFAGARESMGPMQSERGQRSNLLDFSAGVLGGKLWIGCTYSTNLYNRETIETITSAFVEALRSLATMQVDSPAKAFAPSDFPLARLDEKSLTKLTVDYPNLEDVYPLSHMQQGMMFHNLYAPTSTTYFLQLGCSLNGTLNIDAFRNAWRGVMSRHAILRTAFVWQGLEQPLQVVVTDAEFILEQLDWRDVHSSQQEEKFDALLKEDRLKGFDLSKAPLMRFKLIRRSEDSYYFVWSRHHLLMDGWSLPLILREVFTLYAADVQHMDVQMEPTRSFGDYISWLHEQDMSAAESFWRESLQDFTTPNLIGKSVSHNGQPASAETYSELRRPISEEMTQELQSYARRHQLTLNTLLLGVWGILLGRYSSSSDVVFGTAVSGRPPSLSGVESIVGVFINMLPLRVVLGAGASLTDWLKQIQQRQIEMQQYEFTPLVDIQNWSDVPRGGTLFESILVFENYPMDEVMGSREGEGALAISNLRSFDRNNYPLMWLIMPGRELLLRLIYSQGRFDSSFVATALEQFETVLSLMLENSDLTLDEFSTLVNDTFRQHEVTRERMIADAGIAKLRNITRRTVAEVHVS